MCPSKIPKKWKKTLGLKIFWAMPWISFKIYQIHPKFDEDHESVSCFDHCSIVEELLGVLPVYFRTIWVF
jgi:hypothetical protein